MTRQTRPKGLRSFGFRRRHVTYTLHWAWPGHLGSDLWECFDSYWLQVWRVSTQTAFKGSSLWSSSYDAEWAAAHTGGKTAFEAFPALPPEQLRAGSQHVGNARVFCYLCSSGATAAFFQLLTWFSFSFFGPSLFNLLVIFFYFT